VKAVVSLVITMVAGPVGAQAAPRPTLPPEVSFAGSFRTRFSGFGNLDLDRGPTPSTGQPIFPIPPSGGAFLGSADARARLDLSVRVGSAVAAHLRVDALDGLVLGSTPAGFPPSRFAPNPWAASSAEAPSAGRNAWVDSVRLEQVWAEVLTPIGALAFGRMPLPAWGLGLVTGDDADLDADWDHQVDRVAFATSVRDHTLGIAADISAVGPTSAVGSGARMPGQPIDLGLQDDVFAFSAVFARETDRAREARRIAERRPTFSYGLWATVRTQSVDFPGYWSADPDDTTEWGEADAVARRAFSVGADGFFRLAADGFTGEVEALYVHTRLGDPSVLTSVSLPPLTGDGFAVALDLEGGRKVRGGASVVIASGDPAPGFGVAPPLDQAGSQPGDIDGPQFDGVDDLRADQLRLDPGFVVDRILWRRLIGAVADACIVRPRVRARLGDAVDIEASVTISAALYSSSTPGGHAFLGVEPGIGVDWRPVRGFVSRFEGAVLIPGAGLDNPALSVRARPGGLLRAVLAVEFGR
jgi:uncharacterized protein (TIGR04551 family)